jgi:ABC-type oligopeptide transport system substrate-binding subunit
MRRHALVLAVVVVLILSGCSTGQRVDLGDAASGTLVAAIAGEPDQLDPQKTSAYFSFEILENVFDTLVEPDENLEMRPGTCQVLGHQRRPAHLDLPPPHRRHIPRRQPNLGKRRRVLIPAHR